MTKSVYGTFSGIKNKDVNKFMDAVQVYPTTSFLDLPQMTNNKKLDKDVDRAYWHSCIAFALLGAVVMLAFLSFAGLLK